MSPRQTIDRPIDPAAATETPVTPETVAGFAQTASYPPGSGDTDTTPATAGDDDRYQLGAELARGGMGRIVRAVDRRLGRDVAVKVMIGTSGQLAARFDREAMVIARLQHPGIVPIYDMGRTEDGRPFYSMKLVEGRTLHDAIRDADAAGRMELLPHVLAAVDAIAYAHNQRIIHRDLKPLNVLVGAFGETLVIDWGLAKELVPLGEDSDEQSVSTADDPMLTRHGQVVGTPAYMPPEQAAGKTVDERADVYALGAMLYHVLAGQPPFASVASDRLMAEIVDGTPKPLDELRKDLPGDLLAIVDRAMARQPENRYPNAQDMAADLRRHQAGQLVSAHHYTVRQRIVRFIRRHRDAVIATTIMVIAVAAAWIYKYVELGDQLDEAVAAEARATGQREAAEEMSEHMLSDLRYTLEPIGKLALLDAVGRQVDAYYRTIPDSALDDSALARRARAVELRGDIARSAGDSNAALTLYQEAAALGLAAGRPEVTSHVWLSTGDVLFEQGMVDAAERTLEASRDLGSSAAPQVAANARLRLGMVAAARGDNQAALVAWRHSAGEFAVLAARFPADPSLLYNVAVAHGMIGDLLWQMNEVDASRKEVLRSRVAAEKLLASEPENPQWLRALSLTTSRLGEMAQWQGDLDDAEKAFGESLAIAERLASHDPANKEWQSDLAISLRNVAGVDYEQEEYQEAIAHLVRAKSIQERLVAAHPDDLESRKVLSSIYFQTASTLEFAGRRDEAVAAERGAIHLRREELSRSPGDAWLRFHLSDSLIHLGWLITDDDSAAAIASLREARGMMSILAAADDTVTEWRRALATAELGIARALNERAGGAPLIREHATRALPMLERLRDEGALKNYQLELIDLARKLSRSRTR